MTTTGSACPVLILQIPPPLQESKTIFKRLSYDARSNTSVVHCESPERSYSETFVWVHASQVTILNRTSFKVALSRAARIRYGSVRGHRDPHRYAFRLLIRSLVLGYPGSPAIPRPPDSQ